MMKKFRDEKITLITFLNKVRSEIIRSDSDTQRYLEAWKDPMAPSLLVLSAISGRWIPPLLIAEEPMKAFTQQWIGDGNQRCGYLMKFRYANMRLKKKIPGGEIQYSTQVKDENGRVVRDSDGNIMWELKTFDISNHTYDELPTELKEAFDSYTLTLVIYEECNKKNIAEILRIYNNTTSMNNEQKALTHIEKFARRIKDIESEGLLNNIYSLSSKKSGKVQRLVMEIAGLSFHLDNWKKNPIELAKYINDNSSDEEFDVIADLNSRLEEIIEEEKYENMFTFKNAGLLFATFHEFTKLGIEDEKFLEFLDAFVDTLQHKHVPGVDYKDAKDIAFSDIDISYCPEKSIDSSTYRTSKDTTMMKAKRDVLVSLMKEFFKVEESPVAEAVADQAKIVESPIAESFVLATVGLGEDGEKEVLEDSYKICEYICDEITDDDMKKYFDVLDDIAIETDLNSDFYTIDNIAASIGMIASTNVKELAPWFVSYVENYTYNEKDYNDAYEDMMNSYEIYKRKAA